MDRSPSSFAGVLVTDTPQRTSCCARASGIDFIAARPVYHRRVPEAGGRPIGMPCTGQSPARGRCPPARSRARVAGIARRARGISEVTAAVLRCLLAGDPGGWHPLAYRYWHGDPGNAPQSSCADVLGATLHRPSLQARGVRSRTLPPPGGKKSRLRRATCP